MFPITRSLFSAQSKSDFNVKYGESPNPEDLKRPLEVWEEVELNRPRKPNTQFYEWPKRAPRPGNLRRVQMQQFQMGKPQRLSAFTNQAIGTFVILAWCIGSSAAAMYVLRPDDYSFIDEERDKAMRAREALNQKLETLRNSQS